MPENTVRNLSLKSKFYIYQSVGWFLYTFLAWFSGPFWYDSTAYFWDVVTVVVQTLAGVLMTIPLGYIFKYFWNSTLSVRVCVSIAAVVLASIVWTYIRMKLYIHLVPWGTNLNVLVDFGGWFLVSVLVISGWSTFYMGMGYFAISQKDRELAERAFEQIGEAKIAEVKAAEQIKDAQLRMLRYQLNPHFLFNTLNSVCALMSLDRSDTAQKMLVKLSEFLRHSFENLPDTMVSLAEEIGTIKLYLEIEENRFGDMLVTQFDVCKPALAASVPSFLLQPLYENAIKYAIAENEEGGVISLVASVEKGRLILNVSDTGAELSVSETESVDNTIDEAKQRRGIGLANVRARLNTLYSEDFVLDLHQKDDVGFEVIIDIPYSTVDQDVAGI